MQLSVRVKVLSSHAGINVVLNIQIICSSGVVDRNNTQVKLSLEASHVPVLNKPIQSRSLGIGIHTSSSWSSTGLLKFQDSSRVSPTKACCWSSVSRPPIWDRSTAPTKVLPRSDRDLAGGSAVSGIPPAGTDGEQAAAMP